MKVSFDLKKKNKLLKKKLFITKLSLVVAQGQMYGVSIHLALSLTIKHQTY